ncbi:stage II sporulation protein M [Candidatus Pacearchaeota archaeon]|nr:stage II sporulation protein M [Candidatus Pacearchaeota archaeon]
MLDLLFNPEKAERHPIEILIIASFYSILSIVLGLWIFKDSTSLAIIFLTTLSCLYVVQGAIKMEEKKEKNWNDESWLLQQHKSIAILILMLFLGFTFSFAMSSFFFPPEISQTVFEMQGSSVDHIKLITGKATDTTSTITNIFKNNTKIILISLVFAIFYGAGAIYIIAWNASVMGFVIGSVARETFGLAALPISFAKYFLHGIPEMLAYILAAIAGGILYFAFIKGDLTNKDKLKRIILDTLSLILIAILLLLFSAILEVYVSPLI